MPYFSNKQTADHPVENEDDDEYEDEKNPYSIARGDLFRGGGNNASNSERIFPGI